ncbi:collagen alpha-1(III) chain-like isoform X3 [Atheta coriaria]|uniref:collagen alpha-1(III) chain-like isoform X3 n=1 Tax=Dalotia coriaria TaxID=877792 RepID=UPI0031F44E3A
MNHWPSRPGSPALPAVLLALFAVMVMLLAPSMDAQEDYNIQHNDGSYEFGYENENNFHHSKANSRNVVRGEFGGRNPKTGGVDVTSYTAGPRGYRPRGSNIARKFDQSQVRRGPIGSRDDPYYDPNEDPSYDFGFKTRTYQRKESANRLGDVKGQYSYTDDVGERHNVEYIAGKNTGFHVKTPFPDSNPKAYGPLFFNGRGRPIPRGRTSIQRGTDGSYRFVAAGPDQRRTEVSDSEGNVRGSYTYLDDKGVQHSVHYIAGPGIGYRVLKNVNGPHLPSVYPFTGPNIIPPDFYNYIDKHSQGDVFNAPEEGPTGPGSDYGTDYEADGGYGSGRPSRPNRPNRPGGSRPSRPRPKPSGAVPRPRPTERPANTRPSYDYDDGGDLGGDDLFGGGTGSGSTTARPPGSTGRPSTAGTTSGTFSGEDITGGGSGTGGGGAGGPPGGAAGGGGDDYDDNADDLFGSGPSISTSRPGSSTSRPTPGSTRPSPNFDTGADDGDDGDINNLDDGLFGGSPGVSSSNLGVTGTPKPHVISITGAGGKKTIVTNLGDRVFSVPPGVSVHAHVQSIDLYPYESKVPTPADQYRAETTRFQRLTTRQVSKDDEKLVTVQTTTLPSTTSTPTSTTPDSNSKKKTENEVSEEYEDEYESEETSADDKKSVETTTTTARPASTTKTIK